MTTQVDIFPALVTVTPNQTDPPFQITDTRVALINERIIIVRDASNGPEVVFDQQVVPGSYRKEEIHHEVDTVAGLTLRWRKDASCGCGSRLRTWRPYKYITS